MPGVRLCEGRWQEVVPQLIQEGVKFDGIFFDTVSRWLNRAAAEVVCRAGAI
jgi:hypothetical protein